MRMRKLALTGAAAVAFAGLLSATPTLAFTHHPATPEEIQQTDALNAQALVTAQTGTKPNQPMATTAMPAMSSPDAVTPAPAPEPASDATPPTPMAPPTPVTPPTGTTATPPPPIPDAPTQ